MKNGQAVEDPEIAQEIHDSDYSEWPDGPDLITRSWRLACNKVEKPLARPYVLHSHLRGQLLCIASGLIQVHTEKGTWVLPPQRAGWIPPGSLHGVHLSSVLNGWSLLFSPKICAKLPAEPCVITMSELLKALVNRTESWNKTEALSARQKRKLAVIVDEVNRAPQESLYLPMPKDPRLARIAQAILDNPGSMRNIEQCAALGPVSPRTLRRLMRLETGMGFSQWRQQVQLIHALEMLARGVSVTDVADTLGYATPSNFIAMFRRAFGDSPARFFSEH